MTGPVLARCKPLLMLCLAILLVQAHPAAAQGHDAPMSDGEVEKLREAAYYPINRIEVFVKILDSRSQKVQDLVSKPRRPGREQQLHDLFDQFAGIADELNDNLDEYAPKHRDIRKALPKLIDATERWATILRSAPEDASYKVVRKLALDAVRDVHDAAAAMQTDQVAYFKAHPEAEKAERDRIDPPAAETRKQVDIPR